MDQDSNIVELGTTRIGDPAIVWVRDSYINFVTAFTIYLFWFGMSYREAELPVNLIVLVCALGVGISAFWLMGYKMRWRWRFDQELGAVVRAMGPFFRVVVRPEQLIGVAQENFAGQRRVFLLTKSHRRLLIHSESAEIREDFTRLGTASELFGLPAHCSEVGDRLVLGKGGQVSFRPGRFGEDTRLVFLAMKCCAIVLFLLFAFVANLQFFGVISNP